MDLLAPDVTRIGLPEGAEPADDRVPASLASGTPEPLRGQLVAEFGADRVLARITDLVRYASDASPYRLIPQAVIEAHDAADVAKAFAFGRRTGIATAAFMAASDRSKAVTLQPRATNSSASSPKPQPTTSARAGLSSAVSSHSTRFGLGRKSAHGICSACRQSAI
jgi:hypothetical protein